MNRQPHEEVYVEDYECHAATAEEREAFVREAPDVIAGFRGLLDQEAKSFEETAKKATKLTPR